MSKVYFTPLGGGAEIGANCFSLGFNGHTILLDCGIHPKKEGREQLPDIGFLKRPPAAILVSHAHIDHCGAVPYALREFRDVPCYATKPTIRMMDRMLHNSVSVMSIMAEERGISDYPLYYHSDVDSAMKHAVGFDFEQEFIPSLQCPATISFHHSGHVLGAASILLQIPGHNVLYTGDISTTDQELLAGLAPLDSNIHIDTLIIECTRGAAMDNEAPSFAEEIDRFCKEIVKVLDQGGCVLVPAFALGRTQELLNIVDRLQAQGRLPDVPVYASGLGRAVYEVYHKFEHLLRPEASLVPLIDFERIGDVWDPRVSKQLLEEPAIVVATSGMMLENTPSAMIAREMVREQRHGIFFVGYLDPDTLGHKLLHAEPGARFQFELNGKDTEVKLENIQRFHFSSHANRSDLQEIVARIEPSNAIFVHGDPEAIEWMHTNCNTVPKRFIPEIGTTIQLEA